MKKKFITVISLLLALIMSLALIACGGDRGERDNGTKNDPPDVSAAIAKLLTSDGFTGSVVWSFDADDDGSVMQLEKRGNRIKVITADEKEMIFDISTGYLYSKGSAGYYFEQKLPANAIDYAAYMLGNQFEGVDLTKLEDDEHISYDNTTRTLTVAYDEAERINTLLAPLYSAYKQNATLLTLINSYLALVSPNPQYPLTVDTVLSLIITLVKANPDMTVGSLIALAEKNGMDVYGTIEKSGVLDRFGITLDDKTKAVIEARKVSELILAMYGMAKSYIPSATVLDAGDGSEGAGSAATTPEIDFDAIFEALFVTPVESNDINADLDDAKTVIIAGLNLIRVKRDIVDKYLGAEDATPVMRELYAVIQNQVEIEKLNASLSIVFDENNDIAEIKANAAFKHDYDGDTEGFKYLSQNNYYFAFDLTIDSYTAEGTEFAIDFAADAYVSHTVIALAYGELEDEISVYYEIGDNEIEIASDSDFMTYDAQANTFVFDMAKVEESYADEITAGTFDGIVVGVASITGEDAYISVILRIMPDDPEEALSIIFEYVSDMMGWRI